MANGGTTALPPADAYAVAGRERHPACRGPDASGQHSRATGPPGNRLGPVPRLTGTCSSARRRRGSSSAAHAGRPQRCGSRSVCWCWMPAPCTDRRDLGPRATPDPVLRGTICLVRGRPLRRTVRAAGRRPRRGRDPNSPFRARPTCAGPARPSTGRPVDSPVLPGPSERGSAEPIMSPRPRYPVHTELRLRAVAGPRGQRPSRVSPGPADGRWLVVSSPTSLQPLGGVVPGVPVVARDALGDHADGLSRPVLRRRRSLLAWN